MVLGKLQVPGRPTILIIAIGAVGGCLDKGLLCLL